jgi:hypothetical protein
MLTRIPWSLNELLKFVIFCAHFVHQVKMTAPMIPVSVGALPRFRCCALS